MLRQRWRGCWPRRLLLGIRRIRMLLSIKADLYILLSVIQTIYKCICIHAIYSSNNNVYLHK